jgi:apoptosis-inducing factor 2
VTIVEPREAHVHVIGQLRAVVKGGEFAESTFMGYDALLPRGRIVRDTVVSIRECVQGTVAAAPRPLLAGPDRVELEGGKFIDIRPQDFLIIATGSKSVGLLRPLATDTAGMIAEREATATALRTARKVVVVGGGPTGIELAGEVKAEYPEHEVILVSRGERLLDSADNVPAGTRMPESFQRSVLECVRAAGVQVRFGMGVVLPAGGVPASGVSMGPLSLELEGGGESIDDVDVVFWAMGVTAAHTAYSTTMAAHTDAHNRLRVSPTMQVEGLRNVFAVGDCAEVGSSRTAYQAGLQSSVAAKNIIALASGKTSLSTYSPGKPMMLIPVGPTRGRVLLPLFGGMEAGDGMVASIKGKDLLRSMRRKEMGLDA